MLPPAAASPNLTPVTWENPVPVIVTLSPTTPLCGVKEVMVSGIVKVPELRAVPATVVSAILPVVAPAGTVALTCVALTGVTLAAATPLKVTPVGPDRFDPLIVTTVPATPLEGLKPEIVGGKITVNATPFETPAAVTTVTAPLVAVSGTVTVTCESSSTENVDATTPPNLTALAPVNVVPVITVCEPRTPDVGANETTLGNTLNTPTLDTGPAAFVNEITPLCAPAGTVSFN
jgi:hypothetical protein